MKILVISNKDSYAAKRLAAEAKIKKQKLEILGAGDLAAVGFKIDVADYDVLYIRNPYVKSSPKYLPQIISLAKKFKAAGKKVVDANIAKGILGQGKGKDYQRLKKAGLTIPQNTVFSSYSLPTTHYPLILKWIYGFKGKGVFLIHNADQLKKTLGLHPKKEWLIEEYLPAEFEYKIMSVGYKALPVILRFAIHPQTNRPDFDSFKIMQANNNKIKRLIEIAQRASKVLGRELAKVDILESNGRFYILEVNRFPGLDSFEELTKYNVAKGFLEYLQS